MKNLANYIFPVLLIIVGGALLIVGAMQGQNSWVMLGAGLALIAGLVSIMLQLGLINRKMGMVLGLVFAVMAIGLAYRNYRSVNEVLEFNERKLAKNVDRVVYAAGPKARATSVSRLECVEIGQVLLADVREDRFRVELITQSPVFFMHDCHWDMLIICNDLQHLWHFGRHQ